MSKQRVSIPKAVRDKILAEFNHRCAVCGADRPHIDHIDEDPSNNEPMNLLPLCPNCHLTDKHNPTSKIDNKKLALFRQFKDPAILSPQFHPLYLRLGFVNSINLSDEPVESLERQANELVDFVRALNMGSFYAQQLNGYLERSPRGYVRSLGMDHDLEYERQVREDNRKYRQQMIDARSTVTGLCVELLRYQEWNGNNKS
jgi:hypothetical protein